MKTPILVVALLTTLAPVSYAQVVTIASWDFEQEPFATSPSATPSSTGPSLAAVSGSGAATGFHASSAAVWSSPVGNGSGNSMSVNNWGVGDYFQFQVSTLGHQDVKVAFDQTSSGTGPRDFKFQYSTDGSAFVDFQSYSVLANSTPNAWTSAVNLPIHTFNMDFSAVPALDGQANVFFRLTDIGTVSANGTTVAVAGTDRVDNFIVSATPVPEPHHYALIAGFGLVGFAAWRRRLAMA